MDAAEDGGLTQHMSADTQIVRNAPDNGETKREEPAGEVRVSVRSLVEFILRQGDIDNRRQAFSENAMQEGSRIHRMIQKRMGADYQAEVSLKYTHPTDHYVLIVEGRADGVIDQKEGVVIDEIKGTYRDLAKMREPVPVHVAQAKCYAYIYGLQHDCQEIRVRMTYCNMETEELRYFYEDYTFEQLAEWFGQLIEAYKKWADYSWEWRQIRQASIGELSFPFSYRDGQKELVTYVYQTIYHKRKLFLEAPTGVGKTISTVFPAVKAIGQGMGDKLFYLTAKTITRTVAEDTLELLRRKGLRFKSVVLTAKEKICFLEKAECNPESCPYAKGHYDRINDALFALLTGAESFTRERIEEYAGQYQVCPFELGLDVSLFADGIIGDYNYLFDPHVYLKRFFAESAGGDYLFLIDEAHNLLERGREMYSASLVKETFLELRREIKQTIMSETQKSLEKSEMAGQMTLEMTMMSGTLSEPNITKENDAESESIYLTGEHHAAKKRKRTGGKSVLVREGYGELLVYHLDNCNKELLALKREGGSCRIVKEIDGFVNALMRLYAVLGDYLGEQEDEKLSVREPMLDFYFEVSHFLETYERVDEHYVKYTQIQEDGSFLLKLFCVNPRENLKECMMRGRSAILFSATFLPIQYYKELLGGDKEDYEVYAKSVFRPEKRGLFIANDVTSKYTRRSEEEYWNIARYIDEIVGRLHGNYMVFCPSYSFLRTVYEIFQEHFGAEDRECIVQQEHMSEEDREIFLNRFRGNEDCDLQAVVEMEIEVEEEQTLIGFCVMGGIFSEGIDLKNDSLIGAIIVGTGLPQVCNEREILKGYFDDNGENGFDFAYRYPGMNKVLQAAGRVIRTAEDIGIIALLDERFLQPAYRRMFPREWTDIEIVSVDTVSKRVERFWDSWL
ncbi:MAG: ATP-dependent DNA helicase [Candidatus Gastranaerophilales bacterium]|nr:ATP-dependent DNA helicase [Candidatus Gastranaerophilales bacterium]